MILIKNIILAYYYSLNYAKMQYIFKNNVSKNYNDSISFSHIFFNYRSILYTSLYIYNFVQTNNNIFTKFTRNIHYCATRRDGIVAKTSKNY